MLVLAFVLPFGQLLVWSWGALEQEWNEALFGYALRSVTLSMMAALMIVSIALLLSYARRRDGGALVRLLARVATLGYAVPGTVLAVGIFVPIAWLDNVLIEHFFAGRDVTAVLKGTLAVMLLAYVSRFLAVGYSAVDAAMNRITRSQEEAARNLGYSGFALLRHVHLPLLQGGLLTGVLMVFVDVMKEMPITMMTRPFGWDTLAVRIYGLTSEGVFDQAALPAVVLVLVGLIPTLLLSRQKDVA
ncbi:putative 2-aminoethylphosphonate transport system permease protein PhnV [compost metagenome]